MVKVWQFLKKIKIELPYDPASPFLGIYTKELKARPQRNIYTPMFMKALFTVRGRRNPSVHQGIRERTQCGLPIQWTITQL